MPFRPLLLACLFMGMVGSPNGAFAIDLCEFVKKVVVAKEDEFVPLKGAEAPLVKMDHTIYHGTLTPTPASICTLYVRRLLGKSELAPNYSCDLGRNLTFEQAAPIYEQAAADLRACFPQWKFKETKEGEVAKREEAWQLVSEQPGVTIRMGLSDIGALADLINAKPSGKPGVWVSINVENTAPPKPGLTLEIPRLD